MEVLCINDVFTQLQRSKIKKLPIKDKIYSIRDVVTYTDGVKGLLLNEIHNPYVQHDSGLGSYEPTFNINRFTTLSGDVLTKELLNKISKTVDYE